MNVATTERQALEERRRIEGLSVAKVSRDADISYGRLWNYFTGRDLTDEEMQRLRRVLGLVQSGVSAGNSDYSAPAADATVR